MLALTEKQMLMRAIGQFVCDEVALALSPIKTQMTQFEKLLSDLPVPVDGKDGKDGIDGKDADSALLLEMKELIKENGLVIGQTKQWIRDYVQGALDALPVPVNGKDADMDVVHDAIQFAKAEVKAEVQSWTQNWTSEYVDGVIRALPQPQKGEKGDKGDSGANGLDGSEGAIGPVGPQGERGDPGERGEKGERGEPGEPGKDGTNGRDGIDGKSITLDDIRQCLADLVAKAIAELPIPRGCNGGFINRAGHLFLTFSDGSNSDLGEVVGRDGKDCDFEVVRSQVADFLATIEKPKDGKDGLGFDDLEVEHDGVRLVTFKFVKGDTAKVFNLLFPVPVVQGMWTQGQYLANDIVQRDGSMWIAQKDTETIPGTLNSDWKLCTKRGRDGKDGKPGPQGKDGKPGRNGQDLTKIGPDGSKW